MQSQVKYFLSAPYFDSHLSYRCIFIEILQLSYMLTPILGANVRRLVFPLSKVFSFFCDDSTSVSEICKIRRNAHAYIWENVRLERNWKASPTSAVLVWVHWIQEYVMVVNPKVLRYLGLWYVCRFFLEKISTRYIHISDETQTIAQKWRQ